MKFSEFRNDLIKYFPNTDFSAVPEELNIVDVSDSTERMGKGFIFAAVRGKNFDGHNAASDMMKAGAAAFVVEEDLGLPHQIITPDSRKFYGYLCAAFFEHPERRMKFAAVTGTNGKTTTASLVAQVLISTKIKTGLIGTTGVFIDDEQIRDGKNTSPPAYEFYSVLAEFAKAEVKKVIMEVSSFALAQSRLGPVRFTVSAFTNLTQDHLDYHENMDEYYEAKKKLFTDFTDISLINTDDEFGKKLYGEISGEKYEYGMNKKAHIHASALQLYTDCTRFRLTAGNETLIITTKLIGEYNVYNTEAAIGICTVLGVSIKNIARALEVAHGPDGRTEVIPCSRNFSIIRDYAHTPDALENVLKALRQACNGRLVVLFGCGGDRDREKRPIMGRIATENADFTIVTSDNPRNEDPVDIIEEILTGISVRKPVISIIDRKTAIRYAIENAMPDDLLLLAGKGHETYQILAGGVTIPFDERKICSDILSEYYAPMFDRKRIMTISAAEILIQTNGIPKQLNHLDKRVNMTDFYIDTRAPVSGGVYIGIKGDHYDGNDFVKNAFEKGAALAITEKNDFEHPCILVKNGRTALMDIAAFHRKRMTALVIGITGSVGKTTTKDMIALAMSSGKTVFKTEGNNNNEIGVPLSLLKMNDTATCAVIEMGMSHFGEISKLSGCIAPDICVITNIGFAHIENFESQEEILKAKLEILDGASKTAPLVVNGDDPLLKNLQERYERRRKVITFGIENQNADYVAVDIHHHNDRSQFSVKKGGEYIADVEIYVRGGHNIINALCAVTVADIAGIKPAIAGRFLSAYQPGFLRQNIEKRGQQTVITDCYNASPASMEAALKMLGEMETKPGARRVAVLADMLELGQRSKELHEKVGEAVVKNGIDLLVCFGNDAKYIAKRADELGMHSGYSTDKTQVKNFLKYKLKPDDIVLFKGSRGMHLETIIEEFYN
ncbi:MAG: UDP-N-acetylmuramoyl-L-alanyl-D-glutamate--2,6-diaminopimelate ligase [Ruminococcus sp.]|jgi:UDP-N-acetylmuramyl-tripeptide synthetase/UDP-N-acetylmuramoyl-tripeptide--D-alanyl-D-alanine ligase|nr:UDP-N-acetylmuramoyl-L-alanyl-D-glutamate--2,6-diaminopimelate ligase [Ruminococcus sp.]